MTSLFRRHLVVLMASAAMLCGTRARAQSPSTQPTPSPPSPPSSVESWVAFAASTLPSTGRLETSYLPQVALTSGAEGRLGQTLSLESSTARGFEAGAHLFLSRHAGIQAFVSRTASDLAGRNDPFHVELRYVSRPPPNYEPTPVVIRSAEDWPDTSGRLRQWAFGAGPVIRRQGPRMAVSISGGLAWLRISGEAEPLGFTTFRLGGHSVLFAEDYRVRAALGATTALAGYVGGAVDVLLGPHVAVTVGARIILAPDIDVTSRIDAIVDATSGLSPPTPGEVDRLMAPTPARLSPRSVTLVLGIKAR